MKINQKMREQVARNLLTAMKAAGVENPNQIERLTDNISVQQVRNILNLVSGATVDSLGYLSEALETWPSILVATEPVRISIEESGVEPHEIAEMIIAFCGTTPEGRKMIADIAAIVPKRQPV